MNRYLAVDLRKKLKEGMSLDEGISHLKSIEASIIEWIVAVERVEGCGVKRAKEIVSASTAWAEFVRETDIYMKNSQNLKRTKNPNQAIELSNTRRALM
jgi:hypothetical protein